MVLLCTSGGEPWGQSCILGSIVTLASNRDLHPVSAQQLFTRLTSFPSFFLLPPGLYQLYGQFWEYGGEGVRRLRGRRRKFHFQKESEEFSNSLAIGLLKALLNIIVNKYNLNTLAMVVLYSSQKGSSCEQTGQEWLSPFQRWPQGISEKAEI